MSKKSKHKKKKYKQKEVPISPPQQSQPNNPNAHSKHTLFLTIVGLVLAAIGLLALIELFPRLSASATSATNLDNVLGSSKFTITNEGYLKVVDVMSACFLWKAKIGPVVLRRNLAIIVSPPEAKLVPTEGFTVPCISEGMKIVATSPPNKPIYVTQADLALVVYYRAWPFTFYRDHRLFRFVAHFGNQEVTWEKQPAVDLEPDFNNWIAEHGGTFPPKISH
jgi:hypothetical protein